MICPRCGFNNVSSANYCRNCGNPLYQQHGSIGDSRAYNASQSDSSTKNLIIIFITFIIVTLIVVGTLYVLYHDDEPASSNDNQADASKELYVNEVSFYLDGNPNTGIPATINVGKEHTWESMDVMTTYSRDGSNLNSPSSYESHVVDEDGNIKITEYAPIPRYPDYCLVEIRYNNGLYRFGCQMGKYKGSQTSTPQIIE